MYTMGAVKTSTVGGRRQISVGAEVVIVNDPLEGSGREDEWGKLMCCHLAEDAVDIAAS